MKTLLKFLVVVIFIFTNSVASAESPYPRTLENGNLVCVDGGMGVGRYAVRSSVDVRQYAPPFYQISIDIISVSFSDKYWREHGTYVGGPYEMGGQYTRDFKYNWDSKTLFINVNGVWKVWDININHSHADGQPLVPYAAEVAFVSAYNMKFFSNMRGAGGYRVIDESLYDALGI